MSNTLAYKTITPHLRGIANLAARGKTNNEIATELGLKDSYVKFALTRIYSILKISREGNPRIRLSNYIGSLNYYNRDNK